MRIKWLRFRGGQTGRSFSISTDEEYYHPGEDDDDKSQAANYASNKSSSNGVAGTTARSCALSRGRAESYWLVWYTGRDGISDIFASYTVATYFMARNENIAPSAGL